MAYIVPEKGINYAVYLDGERLLGIAEVELPSLEEMTSEVKGAGIAGSVNSPVIGHYGSSTLTLTWRNVTDPFFRLAAPKVYELSLYQAQQDFDATAGEYEVGQLQIFIKGIPTNTPLGKLVVGEGTDTQTQLELIYIKILLNGEEELMIDKYNFICRVQGVDYLADVRKALAM